MFKTCLYNILGLMPNHTFQTSYGYMPIHTWNHRRFVTKTYFLNILWLYAYSYFQTCITCIQNILSHNWFIYQNILSHYWLIDQNITSNITLYFHKQVRNNTLAYNFTYRNFIRNLENTYLPCTPEWVKILHVLTSCIARRLTTRSLYLYSFDPLVTWHGPIFNMLYININANCLYNSLESL